MTFALYDFRCQVLGCATQGERFVFHDLGKSEVTNSDVAFVVQQQVFWFQVPVGNVLFMQLDQSDHNLHCIKHCNVIAEPGFTSQPIKKFSSRNEIQNYLEILPVF